MKKLPAFLYTCVEKTRGPKEVGWPRGREWGQRRVRRWSSGSSDKKASKKASKKVGQRAPGR